MKVYTRPSRFSYLKFLFFFRPLSSIHLFQSNQRFQAIEFVGPTRFGKALTLIFPKLSSQNMRGFDHATIFSPSFHGLCKERLTQWPHLHIKYDEKSREEVLPEKLEGGGGRGGRHVSLNPYPSVIFPTLFQTWSPGARQETGALDKLLRHMRTRLA